MLTRFCLIRIFLVEGLVTIVFSIFVFIFTPHFPAQDKWMSKDDQAQLLARLQLDKGAEKQTMGVKVNWKKIVFDYKIWLLYVGNPPRDRSLWFSVLTNFLEPFSSSVPTCPPDLLALSTPRS